jgi:hypothetical protein
MVAFQIKTFTEENRQSGFNGLEQNAQKSRQY